MEYGNSTASNEALNLLQGFWPRITNEIENLGSVRALKIFILVTFRIKISFYKYFDSQTFPVKIQSCLWHALKRL